VSIVGWVGVEMCQVPILLGGVRSTFSHNNHFSLLSCVVSPSATLIQNCLFSSALQRDGAQGDSSLYTKSQVCCTIDVLRMLNAVGTPSFHHEPLHESVSSLELDQLNSGRG